MAGTVSSESSITGSPKRVYCNCLALKMTALGSLKYQEILAQQQLYIPKDLYS